jgi:hypothetical protein
LLAVSYVSMMIFWFAAIVIVQALGVPPLPMQCVVGSVARAGELNVSPRIHRSAKMRKIPPRRGLLGASRKINHRVAQVGGCSKKLSGCSTEPY